MFASSTLIFAWFPIVGPYSLAGLLLFSAYVTLTSHSAESSPWLLATAGLLLGFSVDTRSNLLLVTPLFLWWLFRNYDARSRLNSILWFLGGFLVGLAPCLYLFIPSPDTFLFNNLGYHAIRSNAGLIGMVWEKLGLVIMFLLGGPGGNGIQNSILFFVSLGFVFSIPGRRYPPRLALQIALVVIVLSLLPTPAYMPYFCLCIPFLVVSATCSIRPLVYEPGVQARATGCGGRLCCAVRNLPWCIRWRFPPLFHNWQRHPSRVPSSR